MKKSQTYYHLPPKLGSEAIANVLSMCKQAFVTFTSDITLEAVVDLILHDEQLRGFTSIVHRYIQGYGKQSQEVRDAKSKLPGVIFAAHMKGTRRRNNIDLLSGLVWLDFDLGDEGLVPEVVARVDKDPHTLLRYITASGQGVRVVASYLPPASAEGMLDYLDAFRLMNDYYAALTGHQPDPSVKDPSHLSFLAHDPSALFRPEATPFQLAEPEEEPRGLLDFSTDDLVEAAERVTRRFHVYAPGNRHNYLNYLFFTLNRMGLPLEQAVDYAERQYADFEDNKRQHAASVYNNNRHLFATWESRSPQPRPAAARAAAQPPQEEDSSPKKGAPRLALAAEMVAWLEGEGLALRERPEVSPLRYNEVSQRLEYEGRPITDRDENSLWLRCERALGRRVPEAAFLSVLQSEAVPAYHPFRLYLEGLPEWDGEDYIARLASTVRVVPRWRHLFEPCLRVWLSAMVASWVDRPASPNAHRVNHLILTLIGPQGVGKTSFFRLLLPPALAGYYCSKSYTDCTSKDFHVAFADNGLVVMDEFDAVRGKELDTLKDLASEAVVDVRRPYERHSHKRLRLASLAATGNVRTFLTDSENRRWLPFEVEAMENPNQLDFRHEGLYAQVLSLVRQGAPLELGGALAGEVREMQRDFLDVDPAEELIASLLTPPREGIGLADLPPEETTDPSAPRFMTSTQIRNYCCSGTNFNLPPRQFYRLMAEAGFKELRHPVTRVRGFIVVLKRGGRP